MILPPLVVQTWLELPAWLPDLGWAGVALIVVVLVLRGKLLPESTLEKTGRLYSEEIQRVQADRDARLREVQAIASTWREAYETERDARAADLQAVTRTLQLSELTLDIIRSWDKALPSAEEAESHDRP